MKKQIQLVDTSLRDGHQSLLATRMSTEQCLRVLPLLVESGFETLELWGGATLDSCLRFTDDDPFERLDAFRKICDDSGRRIQIRSLCRGQNLFGYNPYPDNLVYEFLKEACRSGNDRIRIFDALNDHRNLITAIMTTKTFGGHAEAAISYTTSPVHDNMHFLNFARRCMDAGADSLAVKDMAGLLHPADAWSLLETLRQEFPDVILNLHSHDTNGLAVASYVVAMMCGFNQLDTAYGPMAGVTAQPPIELIRFFAEALGIETNIDMRPASEIDKRLRQIRQELHEVDKNPDHFGNPWPSQPTDDMKRAIDETIELLQSRDHDACTKACDLIETRILMPQGYPAVDKSQLESQIPGGMLSNLYNQLKEQGKLDLMPQVQAEISKVRAAAGYLPLVTPTSQIVGSQAAFNVIHNSQYGFVSEPFRDVIMGRYGKLPGPVSPEVIKLVSRGKTPYHGRAADLVEDIDLVDVYEKNRGLIRNQRELLLMLLFPMPAKQFLKRRHESHEKTQKPQESLTG